MQKKYQFYCAPDLYSIYLCVVIGRDIKRGMHEYNVQYKFKLIENSI